MIRRIGAIVRADFLIRFRRLSTLVVFLMLSGVAYLWVPAPSTGRALMQIEHQRVLYDSAAIGIATALLASICIGLAGFYVVSNALKRDVDSRCGPIIAATTVRSSEYLFGKFLGNLAFLATFVAGYMLASMAMQIVRGEAPLEPLVFLQQYALLASGTIVFVSVMAIVFESLPWLAGRFGDVLYFFLWVTSFGAVVNVIEHGGAWARYFDFSGLGFLMFQMRTKHHITALSIGSSRFNAADGVAILPGVYLDASSALPWLSSLLAPLLLLPLAFLFFHRFDPARTRAGAVRSHRSWLGRFNGMAKPFVRPLVALAMRVGSGTSFVRAVAADAVLTIAATPLIVFAAAGVAIAAIASRGDALFTGALGAAYAIAGVVVADVATREHRAGTLGLVYAAPHVRNDFVVWKLASSVVTAAMILAVPVVRGIVARPSSALPLAFGIVIVAALATGAGIVSNNPKAFIVLFLTLWYVMINDKGSLPALDFAGLNGRATPLVVAAWLAASAVLLMTAQMMHRRRLSA